MKEVTGLGEREEGGEIGVDEKVTKELRRETAKAGSRHRGMGRDAKAGTKAAYALEGKGWEVAARLGVWSVGSALASGLVSFAGLRVARHHAGAQWPVTGGGLDFPFLTRGRVGVVTFGAMECPSRYFWDCMAQRAQSCTVSYCAWTGCALERRGLVLYYTTIAGGQRQRVVRGEMFSCGGLRVLHLILVQS